MTVLPTFTIDHEKCVAPLNCRACLLACPSAVLGARPTKVEKFKETDVRDYRVYAAYRPACIGCMDCVRVCPTGALQIDFEGGGE